MSQEIIYTSAPKGLRPGSRGFCTVESTAGMAKNLADRLESLSGYRHHFAPHEAGENPVNHSHLRLTVGGKAYHVLSRICDAGMDYTKRTNKLAHHIALSANEVAKSPGGPAWAMSQNELLVTTWAGEVRTLPESFRSLTTQPCDPHKCVTWAAQGVDAGWGGALADTAIGRSQPMTVIFKPGTDTLSLVRESIALLPPEKRWDVTFSTYFTKLPAGVDCLWRFVLHGTEEAILLRRNPHARVIDLCDPALGSPPPSDRVEIARVGFMAIPEVIAVEPDCNTAIRPNLPDEKVSASAPSIPHTSPGLTLINDDSFEHRFSKPNPAFSQRRSPLIRNLSIGLGMFLLTSLILFIGYKLGTRSIDMSADAVIANAKEPDASLPSPEQVPSPSVVPVYDAAELIPAEVKSSVELSTKENEREQQRKREAQEAQASADLKMRHDAAPPPKQPSDNATASVTKISRNPFDDVHAKNNRLKLPKQLTKGLGVRSGSTDFVELAKLYVENLAHCDIAFRGTEVQEQGGRTVQWKSVEQDRSKMWHVRAKFKSDLSGKPKDVAIFRLEGDSFQFKWVQETDIQLQLCLMDILVGDKKETVSLVNPDEVDAVQISFAENHQRQRIGLGDNEAVRLKVWFEGDGFGEVTNPEKEIRRGESISIKIPDPAGMGEKKYIEIKVTLNEDPAKEDLHVQALAFAGGFSGPSRGFVNEVKEFSLTQFKPQEQQIPLPGASMRESVHRVSKFCRDTFDEIEQSRKIVANKKRIFNDEEKPLLERRVAVLSGNAKKDAAKKAEDEIALFNNGARATEEKLNKYDEHCKQLLQWCEKMEQLMDRIHNTGRIHFRGYVVIENQELDLVRSK